MKEKNTLTLVYIVYKWYTGAVVESALGYFYGNSATACISFIVGTIVRWIFQKYINK